MKTIEERYKSYIGTVGAECFQPKNIGNTMQNTFIAGAKSEHEELTRWNSPECPPDNDRDVLLKIKSDTRLFPDTNYFAVGFYSGVSFHISVARWATIDVLGWREIHE